MNTQHKSAVQWRESHHRGNTGGQCVQVALVPVQWRKSSHSDDTGGQCVEVASMVPVSAATAWQKSSKSDNTGGACVEVAGLRSAAASVAVRDSKDPDGPKLVFGADAWQAFAGRVKGGTLDLA